jgi:hypothetical protein
MKAPNNTAQFRRAQIVSLSLTEIMLLLVFMAVTFSFLARDESEKQGPDARVALTNALSERDTLRRDVADLEDKLATAAPEVERLTSFLKQSAIDPATLKPHGSTIVINGQTFVRTNMEGKAPGHPVCALDSTYLLNVSLLSGGQIQGRKNWTDADARRVAGLPGLDVLSSNAPLALKAFAAAAGTIRDYGLKTNDCVYAVKVKRATNDAGAFDDELRAVEQYFDVVRMR